MRGTKTGGRTKGTPNRKTTELVARLKSLGLDPVEGLAKIADDPKTPPALKADVLKALLPFIYPKRRSVDVTTDAPTVIVRFGADDALL